MNVLAIRFCSVSGEGSDLAAFLKDGLGMPASMYNEGGSDTNFTGAVFPAGESWVEIWQEGAGMPAGTMLQIVVDDADAMAEHARANGIEPMGPTDAHGERIYFVQGPAGLPISFQSRFEAE